MDHSAASRAARLGILLLSHGNKDVQARFKVVAEEDSRDNGRVELFEHLRTRLRSLSSASESLSHLIGQHNCVKGFCFWPNILWGLSPVFS